MTLKPGTILFASALALTPVMGQAEDDVTVGFAVALSGFVAPYDDGPMKAAQLAIADINERGGLLGRKLVEVSSDTKSDPALGATAATDVLGAGAELVMVTCDFDFGAPAALVAQAQNKIVFSSCAADAKFGVQGIGPNAYTMSTATQAQGAVLAEFAVNELKLKNVHILKDLQVQYTQSLCDSFETRYKELVGEDGIVGFDTYNAGTDTVIASQISQIKANEEKADFLMFCGAINGGSYVRQIRAGGIELPILTGESLDGDFWLEAVPNLSGFYNLAYGSIFGNDTEEPVNDFVARFTEMHGSRPVTAHALTGYSVIEAWAAAVERAGSFDADAVRAELDKFDGEDFLVGKTSYSPELHINVDRPLLIMNIENGKHKPVGRFSTSNAPEIRF